jgi:hypothetical protein
MSWSFTLNGIVQDYELEPLLIEEMATQHPAYPADMQLALSLAKAAGLKTAACTGYRTPNPYGGPEAIGLSVMGTVEPVDFNAYVQANIAEGPDAGS